MAEEYSYRTRSMQRMIKRRKRMKALTIALVSALVLVIAVVLIIKFSSGKKEDENDNKVNTQTEQEHKEEGKIKSGVMIETVDVSKMDYDTAKAALDDYMVSMGEKTIDINADGTVLSVNLASLGLACDSETVLSEAFSLKDAGVVDINYTIDDAMLENILADEEGQFTKSAKNASLKRENGVFTVIKGKKGKEVDFTATKEALIAAIEASADSSSQIQAAAVINTIDPEYTAEDVAKCKNELGKFSTIFKESQISRSANVRNALSFINGTVVYPGETFSVADTIYPLTSDNGYAEAPSYAGGQVVDSLGGGVCQVSTTLYNAVLLAELEIVERAPHSMVVSYVKPAMDAAIAGDYKDFKFKNSSEVPIYIHGSASGGVLTFIIYGEETRPSSRTIKYVSEIVETIEPGKDVVTKDKTKPKSYEKVTQEAHIGYVANLFKIVYENGSETSKEKINYSKYKAEPRYVIKGTKKEKKKDKNNKDKDTETTTQPQATQAPESEVPVTPEVTPQPQPTPVPEPQPTQAPEVVPTQAPAEGEVQ